MAGRSLNESDKESMVDRFLDLLAEKNPQLRHEINSNRDQLKDNLLYVLDMKFPDLTTKSLTDSAQLKQLTEAFSLAVILDKQDPNTKKTLRDELKSILDNHGLMKDGKLNPEKKLNPDEKKALRNELEVWAEKVLNEMHKNDLLPSPKPGMEKQLAAAMADAMMDKVDQGLINLFGVDPRFTGGIAYFVPASLGNGLGFIDQDPQNGGAQINRVNDAYDTYATGGDYTGANAQTEERYRSQADTIAESFLGVLLAENYVDKSPNTPNFGNTSFKPPGSE